MTDRIRQATKTIVALPFGGGDRNGYRSVEVHLDAGFRWVTPELPGHGSRADEPLMDDVRAMAKNVLTKLWDPPPADPYVVFGHSMGAMIGYEMILELVRRDEPLPIFAYFTGCRPPNAVGRTEFADLSTSDFWREMAQYIGLSEAVMRNEKWKTAVEPLLRNDCRAMETYTGRSPEDKIPVPLYYRVGKEDALPAAESAEWERYSSVSADVVVVDGDHFFIHSRGKKVADELSALFAKHASP